MLQKPHVIGISRWDELRTCIESAHPPGYAAMFGSREELPRDGDEEEMDTAEDDAEEKED